MERVAIFVDVQNIYYTVKQNYNCHFNYNAFWTMVTSERKVIKAIAYAIDKGDKKQIKFQQILENIGYEVKLKPFIQRINGSAKGDWDVGIILDMMDYAEVVDTIVLASGDGDFVLAIDKIRNDYNVSVEIYGVSNLTAPSLIDSATQFIPIEGNLLL
jgi:uncharacterized LabA/DUF88 family protein